MMNHDFSLEVFCFCIVDETAAIVSYFVVVQNWQGPDFIIDLLTEFVFK